MMWDTTGQAKDEEEETVMRGVRALSAPVLGSWAFSFLSMRSHIMAARTLSMQSTSEYHRLRRRRYLSCTRAPWRRRCAVVRPLRCPLNPCDV